MKENQEKPGFVFNEGTTIAIGDHKLTLTADSKIHFDGADNEAMVVGMLVTSKNLEVNRCNLEKNYNSFGIEIPGEPTPEPQIVDEASEPADEDSTPGERLYSAREVEEIVKERLAEIQLAPAQEIAEEISAEETGENSESADQNSQTPDPEQTGENSAEETGDQTEGIKPETEDELLAREAHIRADLKAKTIPELKEIAKSLKITLPKKANEQQIIDAIVESVNGVVLMAKLEETR